MYHHLQLAESPFARSRKLYLLVSSGQIKLAGYRRKKIHGTLSCNSGRRMHIQNRVFFASEPEAIAAGYRPCAHCLPERYQAWKQLRDDI